MDLLLKANDLHFAYNGAPAVDGVGMELRAGEVVGVIGPNGSGKSTLIKLLLGHLHPQAGTIQWMGRERRRWSQRAFARQVAYLPQSPVADSAQRVIDVLRLGRAPYLGLFGLETDADLAIVQEVAASLELTDLLDRPMDGLSGGQRQRVFIGRCLAQQPRAMLLDEPNTFLDLRHQVDLCRRLTQLARTRRLGIIMSVHDLNLAGMFADRILLLDRGRPVADGPPAHVLDPNRLSQVYGIPLEALPRGDRPLIVPAETAPINDTSP